MRAGIIEQFENKVRDCIKRYNMIGENDRVIVASSGGKDSTTTLYLLNKFGYNADALIIDLMIGEWTDKNLENTRKFCKDHGIKLHVVSIREEFGCSICYVRSVIQEKMKLSNCMICGVMKRWMLNKKARELGATKLATGHNLDDEAETILMNLFTGNPELSLGLGPGTGAISDKKIVQRIKPLYFCTNEEVRKYSEAMDFPVLYEPCPCSTGSFRRNVRKGFVDLERIDPEAKNNIVRNFLEMLPIFRENFKSDEKLKYCSVCKEPSRNDVCKMCKLMKILGKHE
jgi:uncharacterized protein (TIGR00269 family)